MQKQTRRASRQQSRHRETSVRGGWLTLVVVWMVACGLPALESQGQGRQLQRPWWERAITYNSTHYTIQSDLPRPELKQLAFHLDVMLEAYMEGLKSLRLRAPQALNVMIFKSQRDYLDTLSFRYGVDGTGTGGIFFVNQTATALAFYTEGSPRKRVYHVMQHEGFHQVAYALFGGDLPIWLNEGLAEFFGEAVMVGNKLVIGQSNPRTIDAIKDAIETNQYIPFRRMLSISGQQWNAQVAAGNANYQYKQAWSMVHFLIYAEDGKYVGAFDRYLRLLNNGVQSYNAFVQAFQTDDVEAFERRWIAFAQAARPSAFITALERVEFLAAGALELRRRDILPETLEALKSELQKLKFRYTIRQHGGETTLSASDDSLFTIPMDEKTPTQPEFIVRKGSAPRGAPLRIRRLEAEHPSPPAIGSDGLKPNNVYVVWHRNPDDSEDFRFEIVVR